MAYQDKYRPLISCIPVAAVVVMYFAMAGCVAPYRTMHPDTVPTRQYLIVLDDDPAYQLEISWTYHILKASRNRKYARMEKKNDVQMMVFRFKNSGRAPLSVPGSLLFYNAHGVKVYPFALEDAMGYLVDPITDERHSVVEVEGCTLWKIGCLVNDAKKVISHVKFVKEMRENYLGEYWLNPDEEVTGVMVFPGVNNFISDIEFVQ